MAPTRRPSATRGARSSHRIASSVAENDDSIAQEGHVAQHLAGDGEDAEVDGPERQPEQGRHDDEDAGGESPAE